MAAVAADYYVDTVSGNNGSAGTATGTAWADIQYAADNAGATAIVAVKGDSALGADWDIDTSYGQQFIFVNDSWEDDPTVYRTIDATSATNGIKVAAGGIRFMAKNFIVQNASYCGIYCGTSKMSFMNFKIDSCGSYAVDDRFGQFTQMDQFEFSNCARGIRYLTSTMTNGLIRDMSISAINPVNGGLKGVVIHDCVLGVASGSCVLEECSLDGNTTASDTPARHSFSYCRFTNNTTVFNFSVATQSADDTKCYYYNNGTKVGGAAAATASYYSFGSVDMAGDGYTSVAGHDFTLTESAEGQSIAIALPDGTNTLYVDAGHGVAAIDEAARNTITDSDVTDGFSYIRLGSASTGSGKDITYAEEATRNTDPTIAKVQEGTSYDIQGSSLTGILTALAVPSAPTISSVSGGTSTTLLVSWGYVSTATGYDLYRASSVSGSYTLVGSNVQAYSYLDSGLASGTVYYYKLKAKNGTGDSAFSGVDSGTTTGAATGQSVTTLSTQALSSVETYGGTFTFFPSMTGTLFDVRVDDNLHTLAALEYFYEDITDNGGKSMEPND